MKKQTFLVLLMSALLVTGCAKPAAPESSEPEQPSSTEVTPSEEPSSAPEEDSSEPVEQSSVQPTTSNNQPASSNGGQQSSLQPMSYGPSSGVAQSLTAPENDIHTDLQYSYVKDPDWRNIKAYIPTVTAEGGRNIQDLSKPKAINLKFDELENASTYYVQVSKDSSFQNADTFTTTAKQYELWNAEIGTKYYYRASVSEATLASAAVKEYEVADLAPRNLKIDGVINFRDVGGWKSSLVPNGVIKQGLYYRCAQFNNGNTKNITAAGLAEIKRLNIRVDIDMRDSRNVPSTSPLNTTEHPVEILKASVASSTEDGRWEGTHRLDTGIAATYKKIFEAMAVADQKPIALHCTHGADRTGIVSFFLLAVCGVSIEDCGRDYCLTRFAGERAVLPNVEFDNWVNKTIALPGVTFADKMYYHLNHDFNISVDTLETIRELYVPGYTRAA